MTAIRKLPNDMAISGLGEQVKHFVNDYADTINGPVDRPLARVGKRETVHRAIRKHAEEQAELTDDDPDVLEAYFNKLLEGDLVVVDGPAVRADQLLEDLAHDMRRSAQLRMSDEPRMSTPKKRIAVVGINDHGEAMLDEITVHRHQNGSRTDAGRIQQTVN